MEALCADNIGTSSWLLDATLHICNGRREPCGIYSHNMDILFLFRSIDDTKSKIILLQICERSLNNTQNGPSMPPSPHFVRAEILPSGYLIRPCEGGGSILHIVDHFDLEVKSFYHLVN